MRNNIFKVVFALLLSFSSVFADGQRQTAITEADIFVEDDEVVDNAEYTCRKVKDGYITRITEYDFLTGAIICDVVDKNDHTKVYQYSATQYHLGIVKKLDDRISKIKMSDRKEQNFSGSKISYEAIGDTKSINFTRFLTALVTLDPSVFDFQKIKNNNTVNSSVLVDGLTLRGQRNGKYAFDYITDDIRSNGQFDRLVGAGIQYATWLKDKISGKKSENSAARFDIGTYTTISTADGLNQANLMYFVELFTSMNEIYKHLQNLLFIVIGGWFVGTIGTQKLLKYLENKGEGSGGNQPYLHKFLIPILGVSFFFAPIPEGNLPNQSTTIVQNIIRYFTATGNQIADMAGAIGSKVYVDKLYRSVGGSAPEQEYLAKINKEQAEFLVIETHDLFDTLCKDRFPESALAGLATSTFSDYGYKESIGQFDVNKVVKNQDITREVCYQALSEHAEQQRQANNFNAQIKAYENYLKGTSDGSNKTLKKANTLNASLNTIDKYLSTKNEELGWFNSILIPGSGLMIEVQDFMTANLAQSEGNKNNVTAVASAVEKAALETSIDGRRNPNNVAMDATLNYLTSNLAYLAVPGASMIKNSISSIMAWGGQALGTLARPINLITLGNFSQITKGIGAGVGEAIGAAVAIWIIKTILVYIPAVVATIAAAIAFLSYIVALCKYFYISPFVVAFSITTKRQEKIIDFLLSGVSIFFKPILIVLFIYLALFLHTLVQEIVLILSVSQFSVLNVLDTNFTAQLAIGGIKGIMTIMAMMASCYIMWKLIIKGPDWVMDLIGIKGGQDTIVSDSLAQNLERRSMMVH